MEKTLIQELQEVCDRHGAKLSDICIMAECDKEHPTLLIHSGNIPEEEKEMMDKMIQSVKTEGKINGELPAVLGYCITLKQEISHPEFSL